MNVTPAKKVFIKTYGCQMNVYDSTRMGDVLGPLGYTHTDAPQWADLVILNTCHIREKAVDKVYSELGKLRDMKAASGGRMTLAVAGCVAQAEGREIVRREPAVDLVFGPQSFQKLPELLAAQAASARSVVETEFPIEDKFASLPGRRLYTPQVTAFLGVQEGCDKFCSFCVVPYTRGGEYSRPLAAIEAEARGLVAAGVREITLLGQNVNAWHGLDETGEPSGLGRLLRRLATIEGLARLRFTTSHPRDMKDDLYEAMATEPKIMPFLHLPVQSGSDRILKAMNRGYTGADYLRIVERLRARQPGIAISGDFIVGFPGETDEDFEATLDLIHKVGHAGAFSFKYSPRPGTPAAALEAANPVPEAVKSERLARLQALINAQEQAFNQALIGHTLDVLVEKPGRDPGQMTGRAPGSQPVVISGPEHSLPRAGDVVDVHITGTGTHSLLGHVASIPEISPALSLKGHQ